MNTGYYVTVMDDDGNHHRMRGPLSDHNATVALVIPTSRETEKLDPRVAFWAWGTCKLETIDGVDLPAGKLDRLRADQYRVELAAEIGCRVDQLHEWRLAECESCELPIKIHKSHDSNGLCRYCGDQLRGQS